MIPDGEGNFLTPGATVRMRVQGNPNHAGSMPSPDNGYILSGSGTKESFVSNLSEGDEVEWDETERNWMRSLAEYERSLCPLCGLPRSICQDPKAELTLHAETSVCWATAHMQQAMKRWTDANGRDNPAANALTAHLTC